MVPLVVYLLLFILSSAAAADSTRNLTSLPGCPATCGNISVPFPFGIKPGCFRSGFQLTCINNKLFLGDSNNTIEVVKIANDQVSVNAPIFVMPADADSHRVHWTPLKGGPYTISYSNSFILVGCDISAYLADPQTAGKATCSTCLSVCDSNISLVDGMLCRGEGCSSGFLASDLQSYDIRFERLREGDRDRDRDRDRTSGKAFLTSEDYRFRKRDLISPDRIGGSSVVPLALDWAIRDPPSCNEAKRNTSTYACRSYDSYCTGKNGGYLCRCNSWDDSPFTLDGSPYISGGCPGSLTGSTGGGGLAFHQTKGGGALIGVLVAVGLSLQFLSIRFLYGILKERGLKKVREKHFHKNRGLLLQQMISSDTDINERTKIFSLDELAKSTNNFDETRVLGRGGHGTVFKGILSDQRVVAIKKSKINVQSEIDQFLNEVVILSQINHRNVVNLFGCCLESEVPLLVYEFVSNGTLSDHLHHPDRRSSLSWEDRLSIARDVSGALSYLHSAASISIFHRDVKSSNILLDDHCTAKLSDFGASRSIPLDMTHVVTVVQGTFGYLDPEYYRTAQLTEKSDVYSFGVILVELLTGEKPISFARPEEERNICTHFLSSLKDGRLSQTVEARVIEEATEEEIDTICRLAEACLRLSGEDRPTMKRVEVSLEGLWMNKTRKRHPWKEPKDKERVSLLSSSEPKYGNYPESASSSTCDEHILSITLPR